MNIAISALAALALAGGGVSYWQYQRAESAHETIAVQRGKIATLENSVVTLRNMRVEDQARLSEWAERNAMLAQERSALLRALQTPQNSGWLGASVPDGVRDVLAEQWDARMRKTP